MIDVDARINELINKQIDVDCIEWLLQLQSELAVQSFYWANVVGETYKQHVVAEHNRKTKVNSIVLIASDEMAMNKAEARAFDQTTKLRIDEKLLCAEYKRKKMKLIQLNKIIEHITMRVSHLKKEHELQRLSDHTMQPIH